MPSEMFVFFSSFFFFNLLFFVIVFFLFFFSFLLGLDWSDDVSESDGC